MQEPLLTLLRLLTGTMVRLLTASAVNVGTGPEDVSEARAWLPESRSLASMVGRKVISGTWSCGSISTPSAMPQNQGICNRWDWDGRGEA